jgi:hypothetical protein
MNFMAMMRVVGDEASSCTNACARDGAYRSADLCAN